MQEITVVGFAGGGGSCEGIRSALGRSPDVALNHDEVAVAVHTANHPDSIHYCQNIWKANPGDVLQEVKTKRGLARKPKIGLAWFSPDCKHFSKAKGGKPVEKRIRDLAWVILAWAKLPDAQRPRVIMVENVEEFITWGPLAEDGRPCPERGGEYFRKWFAEFKRLGYKGEHREVVAANKGTPTTRKRLFVIFRNDGLPIVWPEDTHGKPTSPHVITGHRKPWRAAAEIIDWSLPCPSIFDSSEQIMAKHGVRAIRPLAPNTMARIARGIRRYVLDAAEPFIVPVSHSGDIRVHGLDEPLRTVTGSSRSGHALIAPTLICTGNGERVGQDPRARDIKSPFTTVTANGSQGALVSAILCSHYGEGDGGLMRSASPDDPLRTITASPRHSVVTAFLAQHNTDMVGHDMREPVSTIVQKGCTQAVVSAGLVNLKGSDRRQSPVDQPCPTQTAQGWHIAEVRAFLMSYHRDGGQFADCDEPTPTIDTRGRYGLVTVMIGGEPYAIVDIGMRMLTPRELFRAQGFSDSYIIDRGLFADGWRPITKTAQIRLCGNAVCPQVAEALVTANYTEFDVAENGLPEFALQAAE
jgi:DNA (cytosine-5)-methyltransferase 1